MNKYDLPYSTCLAALVMLYFVLSEFDAGRMFP